MNLIGPFKVYSDFGKTLKGEYTTLKDVVLRFSWKDFQENYVQPFVYTPKTSKYYDILHNSYESETRQKNKGIYICKEANGLIIPKNIIKEVHIQLSHKECENFAKVNKYWWHYLRNRYQQSKFYHNFHNRILPKNKVKQERIVRKSIKGGSGYFRAMHTFPEMRDSFASEIKVRSKRNCKNLPNTWDDYFRASSRNYNWKKFRKTQYKNVYKI